MSGTVFAYSIRVGCPRALALVATLSHRLDGAKQGVVFQLSVISAANPIELTA